MLVPPGGGGLVNKQGTLAPGNCFKEQKSIVEDRCGCNNFRGGVSPSSGRGGRGNRGFVLETFVSKICIFRTTEDGGVLMEISCGFRILVGRVVSKLYGMRSDTSK